MTSLLITIFAFIFALSILIAIHEYGHYIVARLCGVKVLRFSIGFGKVLYSYQKDKNSTEFVLAAIPLGGYVKMLDEREGEVLEHEKQNAFNVKSVGQRFAIVAAGPVFNFILAILLLWVMYIHGISGISPIIGEVQQNSIASKAALNIEDEFVSINGKTVQTWSNVQMALLNGSLANDGLVKVTVKNSNNQLEQKTLDFSNTFLLKEEGDILPKIGLKLWFPKIPPIIGGVIDGGAAKQAGLIAGDKLLTVDGKKIETWQDWVKIIRANPNQHLRLEVLRNNYLIHLSLTPKNKQENGESFGYIGAYQERPKELIDRFYTIESYGIFESFTKAVDKTWSMSVLTVKLIGKLITGDATLKNISGPITIAQFAGQSAQIGLDHYLFFMALISLSLGVLNLLPIPVLDGGHLFFYIIEAIKGSPVSDKIQLVSQNIGLAILGSMMVIAFYNDITRLMQ